MTEFDVACVPAGSGWTCRVKVADEDGSTSVSDIERYFPDYARAIAGRLRG